MVERQLPKLDVAGSIPVARSILLNNSQLNFRELEKCSKPSRKASRKFSPRNYQTLKMGLATTFAPSLSLPICVRSTHKRDTYL